jgi:hypothetical protein
MLKIEEDEAIQSYLEAIVYHVTLGSPPYAEAIRMPRNTSASWPDIRIMRRQ